MTFLKSISIILLLSIFCHHLNIIPGHPGHIDSDRLLFWLYMTGKDAYYDRH